MITTEIRKWAALATIFVVIGTGSAAFARIGGGNGNSGTVHLDTAVLVGTTELPVGYYKVTWTGPSDNAQVTLKHDQTTVTTTAKVVEVRRNSDSYVTAKGNDGPRVLTEIQFTKITLVLNQSSAEATGR